MKNEVMKIILTSGSSRRKEIMAMTCLKFEVFPSSFDEDSLSLNFPPENYVREIAIRKAHDVTIKYSDALIIGADTIVVCKNRILGKPKTKKIAIEMLKFCRDKICDVLTGVAIIDTKTARMKNFVDSTKVKMRNYSDQEIKKYVATNRPMYFAGAFAIQDRDWVENIKGSFFNVVGFPILRILETLEYFGVKISKKLKKEISVQDKYASY